MQKEKVFPKMNNQQGHKRGKIHESETSLIKN